MRKNWFAIVIILGLILWGMIDYTGSHDHSASYAKVGTQKGNLAPDFTLQKLDGTEVRLSDYKGKTVFLNFWATWCPPCQIEMPHMQRFYENYEGKDAVVLGVNMLQTEKGQGTVETFVSDYRLTFPIVLDAEGKVSDTYGVISYPTTYVIDTGGVIQEKFPGAIHLDIMKESYRAVHK